MPTPSPMTTVEALSEQINILTTFRGAMTGFEAQIAAFNARLGELLASLQSSLDALTVPEAKR